MIVAEMLLHRPPLSFVVVKALRLLIFHRPRIMEYVVQHFYYPSSGSKRLSCCFHRVSEVNHHEIGMKEREKEDKLMQ